MYRDQIIPDHRLHKPPKLKFKPRQIIGRTHLETVRHTKRATQATAQPAEPQQDLQRLLMCVFWSAFFWQSNELVCTCVVPICCNALGHWIHWMTECLASLAIFCHDIGDIFKKIHDPWTTQEPLKHWKGDPSKQTPKKPAKPHHKQRKAKCKKPANSTKSPEASQRKPKPRNQEEGNIFKGNRNPAKHAPKTEPTAPYGSKCHMELVDRSCLPDYPAAHKECETALPARILEVTWYITIFF